MKILLSNDDGVFAPGIKSLYESLSDDFDTTIIAPLEERSTTGHSLSLDKPLRIEKIKENIYGCSGFPGDCVLVGVGHLLKNARPDVVISGINRGANLGQDLYYSGTIAAAREAAFHHIPAIAVSLSFNAVNEEHYYDVAATFVKWSLETGLHKHCGKYMLLNVNVPNLPIKDIKGCKLTEIGFRRYSEDIHARIDARGRDYFWIAGHLEGHEENHTSDCQAVSEGYIAITPQVLIDGPPRDFRSLQECIEKLNEKFFN